MNYTRRSINISKRSRKRRQDAIERGIYQKIKVDTPPPEAWNNSHISLNMEAPLAADKKTFCPIEYHGPPEHQIIHPLECPNPLVDQSPPPTQATPTAPQPNEAVNTTITCTHTPSSLLSPAKPITTEFSQPCQQGFDLSKFVKEKPPKIELETLFDHADTAMCKALTPRNQDGNYLPIAHENQPQRAMIPYFAPNEDGIDSPLLMETAFAHGQTPANLSYEPGYIVGERDANGNLEYKQFYDDPVKNLAPWQRKALEVGLQTMQDVASEQEEESAAEKVAALSRSSRLDAVIDDPKKGCLYINSKSGLVRLTNFRVTALESHTILGKQLSENAKVEYQLQVICGSITRTITLAPSELDNAVKVIQNEMPSCIVLPGVHKSTLYISNHIRQQLITIPQKVYVQRTGFLKLNGIWQYVHDGAVPPADTVFATGRYIPDDHRVSDAQAFLNAISFLDICGKDELIIPLFLLAHLGPLFQLFHEAGRTPRFVTVLAGRSGSLKTSMSLILFRLFQNQGQTPTASFRDTETAMEIKLSELNGSVGIFDDLRPPVSDLKSKANIEKYEALIRAVGDHTAKSRSNTKLGKAKEFIPSGCALVTAEDLAGSQSSLLRCLVLSISKGDIDGGKLRHFQNNPDLIPTHMSRFISWAGKHGEKIVNILRHNYPSNLYENAFTELRLVDTAAILASTANFICAYAQDIGAMTEDQAQQFFDRCVQAIGNAVAASEDMTKEANPVVMYLEAFFDLNEHGDIRLAENASFCNSENCDGYLSSGYAWVDQNTIYAKVRQYYNRLNIVFPLSEKLLRTPLADAEVIKSRYENRKGTPQRLCTHKSSLPSRKPMIVIDLDRAQAYLEENGNN